MNEWITIKPKFSYFKAPIQNIRPEKSFTIVDAYEKISGDAYSTVTQVYRKDYLGTSTQQANKSKLFDYVTFSGRFYQRAEKQLINHSGYLCFDFDHVDNIDHYKAALSKNQETELLFTSPSGDGLKWVVQVDIELGSHKDYFYTIKNHVKEEYGLVVDDAAKDVSRACFLCHDPYCYINSKYLKSCIS